MDQFKSKYGKVTGRTDSLYIYVLYECSKSELLTHIQSQLKIIDRVADAFKRKLFSSRYYLLRDMVNNTLEEECVYNTVIFISDTLESYNLEKTCQTLLKAYSHSHISYKYSDRFDLEFLEDLIFNETPYHIVKLNNNLIEYHQITKTKKRLVGSSESKTLNIDDFIEEQIKTNRYVMYGVSSKLKGFVDQKCYQIINKFLKDEEVIELISQMDQDDILDIFDKELEMMTDLKQMHKVLFKKEIKEKIEMGQVEKLYLSDKVYDKFLDNMKKLNIEINFKLIKIDTSIKSFTDGREKKINNYDGVIGIAYY